MSAAARSVQLLRSKRVATTLIDCTSLRGQAPQWSASRSTNRGGEPVPEPVPTGVTRCRMARQQVSDRVKQVSDGGNCSPAAGEAMRAESRDLDEVRRAPLGPPPWVAVVQRRAHIEVRRNERETRGTWRWESCEVDDTRVVTLGGIR